jgi:hypothetical protein
MSTFEDLLRKALLGANSKLDAAETDLVEAVQKASAGIEQVTDGKLKLSLVREDETPSAVVFRLDLQGPRFQNGILGFRLPRDGYPITVAADSTLLRNAKGGAEGRKIDNRDGLADLFNEMAANTDSPLVVGIAYFLRTQKQRPSATA